MFYPNSLPSFSLFRLQRLRTKIKKPFYSQVKRQKEIPRQFPTHHSQATETYKPGSSSDFASSCLPPSQFPSGILRVTLHYSGVTVLDLNQLLY